MTPEKPERLWRAVAQALPKERAVNKDNHFIVICMFAGMLLGLAIGSVISKAILITLIDQVRL